MTNSTDVSEMKMTRFGYRVDLIRERHVGVKDDANIQFIRQIFEQFDTKISKME